MPHCPQLPSTISSVPSPSMSPTAGEEETSEALAGLALVVYARLDVGACIAVGTLAVAVAAGGQIYAAVRARA